MAKKPARVYWLIQRACINNQPPEAVLDMLRYDGALVECNAPAGYYLLSNANGPCVARWDSFGIHIASLCNLYDSTEVARALAATPGAHIHSDGTHYRVPHSECRKASRSIVGAGHEPDRPEGVARG